MYNKAVLPAFQPHWVAHDRGAVPHGHVVARAGRVSLFLQHDLNDEALRQPAPPMFNEADLDAVRQEGFDAGHASAMAEAVAAREAAQTASEITALGVISAAMADGRAEALRVTDAAADALAKTLVAAMHSVMPELIRRSALVEVGAMLNHVLPGLAREPAVRIEVPIEIAEGIVAALAQMEQELHDKISVISKDDMKTGKARVT